MIEADFYPENSGQFGHIVVSLASGEIVEYTGPAGFTETLSYVAHARQSLLKLAAQESLPEEYKVMWY